MTVIWRSTKYLISFFVLLAPLFGCESQYTKLVKSELAKGIRQDSVLLGIHLGDTRNDFYGLCYDLNKKQIVTEGANYSVQYIFTDSSVHKTPTPIKLLFVPAFDDNDKLTNLDLKFSYVSWAPWNAHLQADTLAVKVQALLERWYGGNKFIIADAGENGLPVKLDGNRRIIIYKDPPQSIVVKVQDILHPKFQHSVSSGKKQ